jgi:hypothetical protein
MLMLQMWVFLLLLAPVSGLQETKPAASADPWAPLRFIVGNWRGPSTGEPGQGTSERTYEFEFGETFIHVRNKGVYPSQPKNPKGEVHQDTGFFSYDKTRKRFVFRQFHSEGFVNQYVEDPAASDGKSLVFVTEAIENIPDGWRARETYRSIGPDEFIETFELAAPGKEFARYTECRLRRVR